MFVEFDTSDLESHFFNDCVPDCVCPIFDFVVSFNVMLRKKKPKVKIYLPSNLGCTGNDGRRCSHGWEIKLQISTHDDIPLIGDPCSNDLAEISILTELILNGFDGC